MIRTGSRDFAKKMMTPREYGGYKPIELSVREARVWKGDELFSTPEEKDVFALWGMGFVEPEDR